MTTSTSVLPSRSSFTVPLSRTNLIGLLLVLGALYYSSLHSFLLFHSLVELFSVLVSFAIFVIAWNARHIIKNHYLLFLGIAYLFVGVIDLEHTLAYKGMDVMAGWGTANHATQLWIAARYTESLALFIAPFFLQRRIHPGYVFTLILLWSLLLLWSIHAGFFPDCFRDETGLTPFKKISEYVISSILAASFLNLHRRRHLFDEKVYRLLVASILFTIASELAFTQYISVFGPSNVFGHLFKFISAYLLYQALIETGLKTPYSLLFLELKKHEEFLAAQEEEFRSMFELSAVGMARFDPFVKRFLRVNPEFCRITGYTGEELLRMGSVDMTHPEDRQRDRETMENYLAGKTPNYRIEKRYVRKDGKIIWVRVTASIIRTETGRPLHSIGIIEDITTSKLLQEGETRRKKELEKEVSLRTAELARTVRQLRTLTLQLSEAENRERRRLAEILHDDLQQLLAAANLHLDRLAGTIDAGQRRRLDTVIDILKQAIKTSRSLSHDLSPAILYRGSLNAIFEWLASHQRENHGLEVGVTMPDNLHIESDTLRVFLFRAVQELLFNVVKHADTTEASITVEQQDNEILQVTVADSGQGFNPETMVDSDGMMRAAGFGLFSIHERLQLLGGSLNIDSIPGGGSRFVIRLPLHSADSPAFAPIGGNQGAIAAVPVHKAFGPYSEIERDLRPIRVLLADDHATIRQGLEALLKEEKDLEVVGQASNGEEAVRLAGNLRPDVVVMDMAMPKMDGIEATEHISRTCPEAAVIINSMHNDRELLEAAITAGAKACCSKSDSAAQLLAAIRNHGRRPENSKG